MEEAADHAPEDGAATGAVSTPLSGAFCSTLLESVLPLLLAGGVYFRDAGGRGRWGNITFGKVEECACKRKECNMN